ncbi:RluA family pseudouridine synthase [Bacillus piscicola]|uniref:RluA family pseudouridine synthase n=1 Tax=Bacillus piscicola TaxID=1632684 RepID=UPI001F094CEE|nr:RluA family pseudouridine synthase [Bacillus piscicola]
MEKSHTMEWFVPCMNKPLTVRNFLRIEKGMSSRLLKKINKDGKLLINSKEATLTDKLYGGDALMVRLPPTTFPENIPTYKRKLSVMWEDAHLLVIDKPAGLPMTPGRGLEEKTLAGAIRHYYEETGVAASFHAVSRLDRQTSGLVTIAKHAFAHQRLADFFQKGIGSKEYIGITRGIWSPKQGVIDVPIGRKPNSLIEHEVTRDGKYARTLYKVLREKDHHSLVRFQLKTGRTHQIRVHASFQGHPLLGDDLYGGCAKEISRQALHAAKIEFCHPVFETWHTVRAQLPVDIRSLI